MVLGLIVCHGKVRVCSGVTLPLHHAFTFSRDSPHPSHTTRRGKIGAKDPDPLHGQLLSHKSPFHLYSTTSPFQQSFVFEVLLQFWHSSTTPSAFFCKSLAQHRHALLTSVMEPLTLGGLPPEIRCIIILQTHSMKPLSSTRQSYSSTRISERKQSTTSGASTLSYS